LRVCRWSAVVLAARVGVVVAGVLAASCVNLRYPPGASRDGGGELAAHLGTGQACGQSNECQSGFCVDGFCCKTSCSEQRCFTCAKPGNEGFCMPVEVGEPDPHGLCVDENRASCGRNGLCDGAGGCQKYPVGTVCYDSSCFSGTEVTLPSRCNADGVCEAGPRQGCAPYACMGGKCLSSCTSNDHCSRMSLCDANGTCQGDKALGAACAGDADCGTAGKCRQGVCCATECDGGCMSCALAGSEGSCLPVPAGGAPSKTDACKASDPSTCGLDGKCDGAGACRNYIAGTKCAEASCMSATLRGVGTCDGKTHCQVPAAVSCGGFLCASATACRTTCTEDLQCASPSVCGGQTYGYACGGLSAQYFRQTNLTDLAISRTDPAINFHWFGDAPNPLLNKDNFSVRWHGKLTPRFTEKYTFYASTDDGERLFVDGKLVIDRFVRKPADPEDVTAPIMLTAGAPVDIVLEYFEAGGDATAVLSWQSQSEPKAVIPTSALSPQ
jgi:hypothetical protein